MNNIMAWVIIIALGILAVAIEVWDSDDDEDDEALPVPIDHYENEINKLHKDD